MEGFDAGLYLDWDADGVIDLTSDGTLELHSNDWDISTTGVQTGMGNITSDGTIEGATLTEGGNAVYNAAESDITYTNATSQKPALTILNTNDDADAARLNIRKAGASGSSAADGDTISVINFQGEDSGDNNTTFVQMVAISEEVNEGDEAGAYILRVFFDDGSPAGDDMFCIFGDNGTPGQGFIAFNNDSQDMDFRIETAAEDNFFYIDAGGEWLRVGDWDTNYVQMTAAGAMTFAGGGSLAPPNSATPTTDATGEIALDVTITDHQPLWQYFDGGENMTIIAIDTAELPALDNEIIKYNAATDKFVLEADAGGTGGASFITLDIQSGKITGSFITAGATIDAGDPAWRGLFDDSATESMLWHFRMPSNYGSALAAKIAYSMAGANTTDKVDWEIDVMSVADGEDMTSASFDTTNEVSGGTTVPDTADQLDTISITLSNNDSTAAGEQVYIRINRDHDDADDTAAGDAQLHSITIEWTDS